MSKKTDPVLQELARRIGAALSEGKDGFDLSRDEADLIRTVLLNYVPPPEWVGHRRFAEQVRRKYIAEFFIERAALLRGAGMKGYAITARQHTADFFHIEPETVRGHVSAYRKTKRT